MATDIGRLFVNNKLFDGGSFCWFSLGSYFKQLARKKNKNKYQTVFVNAVNEYESEQERIRRERENDPNYLAERTERRKKFLERELFSEIPLPKDEKGLVKLLTEIETDSANESVWHSFHSDIFEMFKRKTAPKYLKAALPIIYNTTRCSFCRKSALREMGRRRMLTEEILNECLYDCNEDIRKFAKRRLKR